jgi:hypothetical protein
MKAIHAAILWLAVFAAAYVVCMHVDWLGLKYYILPGEFHFVAPAGGGLRVKFATTAAVAAAVGLIGLPVGYLLPKRWTPGIHLLGWVVLIAASAAMICRESTWFR